MNPEVKAQWVAALRSGDYQQGNGVLHRIQDGEHTFCCLGVLCDLAEKAGIELRRNFHMACGGIGCDACSNNQVVGYDGYDDFPPVKVWQWAGLPNANPATSIRVDDVNVNATLSYLNDNGKTFEEIADIIERDF